MKVYVIFFSLPTTIQFTTMAQETDNWLHRRVICKEAFSGNGTQIPAGVTAVCTADLANVFAVMFEEPLEPGVLSSQWHSLPVEEKVRFEVLNDSSDEDESDVGEDVDCRELDPVAFATWVEEKFRQEGMVNGFRMLLEKKSGHGNLEDTIARLHSPTKVVVMESEDGSHAWLLLGKPGGALDDGERTALVAQAQADIEVESVSAGELEDVPSLSRFFTEKYFEQIPAGEDHVQDAQDL